MCVYKASPSGTWQRAIPLRGEPGPQTSTLLVSQRVATELRRTRRSCRKIASGFTQIVANIGFLLVAFALRMRNP